MIRVDAHKFQRNAAKYLKNLPVMITRYGKDIALVSSPSPSVITPTESVITSVITNSTTNTENNKIFKGKQIIEEDSYGTNFLRWEWCQANKVHPFEQGRIRKCRLVTYTDKDGNIGAIAGKTYNRKFICIDCLTNLEESLQEGGFDYLEKEVDKNV